MTATYPRQIARVPPRRILRATGLTWGAILLVAGAAGAQDPGTRIRALDRQAALLLERGPARSPTFARLIGVLECSDLVVYIKTKPLRIPGHLQFAAASRTNRFVQITLNTLETEMDMIATLAHELQHAVEVAGDLGIRDDPALERFYQEQGHQDDGRTGYCTREAERVRTDVRNELRSAKPSREPAGLPGAGTVKPKCSQPGR